MMESLQVNEQDVFDFVGHRYGLLHSFGATYTILSYFEALQVCKLQRLNRWMYKRGVSRVQMKIKLPIRFFCFSNSWAENFASTIFVKYMSGMKRSQRKKSTSLNLYRSTTQQIMNTLYQFSWGPPIKVFLITGYTQRDNLQIRQLQTLERDIIDFAVAAHSNKLIFLSGGFNKSSNASAEVSAFDVQTSTWRERTAFPNLVQARKSHSSLAIEGKVYVICGYASGIGPLNSIECLNIAEPDAWQLMTISNLSERQYAVAAAISKTQILILGGHDGHHAPPHTDYGLINLADSSFEPLGHYPFGIYCTSQSVHIKNEQHDIVLSMLTDKEDVDFIVRYSVPERKARIVEILREEPVIQKD